MGASIISAIGLDLIDSATAFASVFVGGGNVIDKVKHPCRIGVDVNPATISALTVIRDRADELPNSDLEFGPDDYNAIRCGDRSVWFGEFALFAYSFGGKYKGGYNKRDREGRDYVATAKRAAVRQSLGLKGVTLINASYEAVDIPTGAIIYADPPYDGCTPYRGAEGFDNVAFWEWCREGAAKGQRVFISEYDAPNDFEVIWEKPIPLHVARSRGRTRVERMFVHGSQV